MPTYDSSARYDSGLRYASAAPASTGKKAMKIKYEFDDKDDQEFLAYAKAQAEAIAGKPEYAGIDPAAAEYDAAVAQLETHMTDITTKEAELEALYAQVEDVLRPELELKLTRRGAWVLGHANGQAGFVLTALFALQDTNPAPIGPVGAPGNLRATLSIMPGGIVLRWKPVKGAKSYIIECREHNVPGAPWQQIKISTKAKVEVMNLTPGKEYAFRVRAVGAAGEGPWSDETVKMANG